MADPSIHLLEVITRMFHIGTHIKPERRHQPEMKSRADVDGVFDILVGADMKTAVL